MKKPTSGDPDRDVIGETNDFSTLFPVGVNESKPVLDDPPFGCGVRRIVTIFRI
jgi:hypothetical protein